MSHQTFVEHAIAAWQAIEVAAPHLRDTATVKRLPDGSKAVIEIRTLGHLATVEVWEHANCTDTTILRKGEKVLVALAAGPCFNWAESTERLNALRRALDIG
jgi:hypothetical protein